ncbi:jg5086, partial [Pararge aegeria aegeria]
ARVLTLLTLYVSQKQNRGILEMVSQVVQMLADALSTATILSCLFLKVPQIMYLRKKKSAEGIYIQAMLMEITGFTIVTLYNYTNRYSVMTYLEYPIILLQVYVMLYYVLKFKQLTSAPIVSLGTLMYFATILGFVFGVVPKELLSYLVLQFYFNYRLYSTTECDEVVIAQWIGGRLHFRGAKFKYQHAPLTFLSYPFCTPLSGSAKVTYIYGIIKAANADAVSCTTWIISILTNISRLFTVYVDSADIKLMINFLVSTILSTGVLCTAIYYQTYKSKEPAQNQGKTSDPHPHSHKD